ncbi:hypothetical protein J8273_4628 [Carpediemonas membranifera]|uniref:Uncharacterized protein n=1 Tax=Carpediemonas membranifera TaxID=201153 RepID=A0A8J6AX73_9EUKA|nr:hypothetical protein J8273_4628 [Carpediemonas membranifera]|eukprot:KAG9393765.1 hypothetical protein J8273_4628 [Carpediemonas membranifera]
MPFGEISAELSLIAAHCLSVDVTASIPGDIPTLLASAFRIEANKEIQTNIGRERPDDERDINDLVSALENMSALKDARASRFVRRALCVMAHGPRLSMNIELADGEELPVAMYTLLQGTIWGILMQAGADPDLHDKENRLSDVPSTQKAYGPEAKALWFICKKFFFTHRVAEKEGATTVKRYTQFPYLFKIYYGRLFSRGSASNQLLGYRAAMDMPVYSRVRVPVVARLTVEPISGVVAVTGRGLYAWGSSVTFALGVGTADATAKPTKVDLSACPAVLEYEARLPTWRKDKLVLITVLQPHYSLLVTRAGVVAAGTMAKYFVDGHSPDITVFNPVPLPLGFHPDSVIQGTYLLILGQSNTQIQMAAGLLNRDSSFNQLYRFTRISAPMRQIVFSCNDFVLTSDGSGILFMTGLVTSLFAQFLPDQTAETMTVQRPLLLPHRIDSITFAQYLRIFIVTWVGETFTSIYDWAGGFIRVDVKVTAICSGSKTLLLADDDSVTAVSLARDGRLASGPVSSGPLAGRIEPFIPLIKVWS